MLADDMNVAAAGIGLPYFDQRVGHAAAVLVAHMTLHDDAFAERLVLVLDGEIVVVLAHGLMAIDRTGELGERVPHRNQRLLRRALDRAPLGGRQRRRMDTLGIDRIDQCHALCSKDE